MFCLFTGYFLIQSKLLCLPKYAKWYHKLCFQQSVTRSTDIKSGTLNDLTPISNKKDEELNLSILNRSTLAEVLLEAIPQMIIQSVNSAWMGNFSFFAILSLSFSSFAILSALYRYVYYHLWHKLPYSQIPVLFKPVPRTVQFGLQMKQQSNDSKTTQHSDTLITTASAIPNAESEYVTIILHPETKNVLSVICKGLFRNIVEISKISDSSLLIQYGIQAGDIIELIDGEPCKYDMVVNELADNYHQTTIVVRRCHRPRAAISETIFSENGVDNILIISLPERASTEDSGSGSCDIGMTIEEIPSLFQSISVFRVSDVVADSFAYSQGVRSGYYVVGVNDKDCLTFSELNSAINSNKNCRIIVKQVANSRSDAVYLRHVIAQHLRSNYILLFNMKNGYPHYNNYKLFPHEYVSSFHLFLQLALIWLGLLIVQFFWFSAFWLPFTMCKFAISSFQYCYAYLTKHISAETLLVNDESKHTDTPCTVPRVTIRSKSHYITSVPIIQWLYLFVINLGMGVTHYGYIKYFTSRKNRPEILSYNYYYVEIFIFILLIVYFFVNCSHIAFTQFMTKYGSLFIIVLQALDIYLIVYYIIPYTTSSGIYFFVMEGYYLRAITNSILICIILLTYIWNFFKLLYVKLIFT